MKNKTMYLLTNYRQIANDIKKTNHNSNEFKEAENYLKKMNNYLVLTKQQEPEKSRFLEKTDLSEEEIKSLYIDILELCFFNEKYLTSNEVISIVRDKYGIVLTPARLSKVKQRAAGFFENVLG